MKKNVFVIGPDDFNIEKLRRLRQVKAGEARIQKLLEYEETHGAAEYPVEDMVKNAIRDLNAFPGRIDAVTAFWDFPVNCMVPIICSKYGLTTSSLESVLKCEHKYWARVEQAKALPEQTPRFQSFDPFDEEALDGIEFDFPFWIKPITAFGSHLAFKIKNKEDWINAIPQIRANIGTFTEPMEWIMDAASVPDEIASNKHVCVAEQVIKGRQCTLEGYVYNGRVKIYGVVDSIRYAHLPVFSRFQYPSKLPKQAQKKMIDLTKKLMEHLEYDNRTFNVEYFYDLKRDKAFLLEVNTRLAQSHADLFEKVDGSPSHEIMVDLAMGREPDFPHREGDFGFAAKLFVREFEDGVVTHVPGEETLEEARKRFPGFIMVPMVHEGMRLSELLYQDSYSYYMAILYMGGKNEKDLLMKYKECVDFLHFKVAGQDVKALRQLPDLSLPSEESLQSEA